MPPKVIGPYRVLSTLGSGGIGTVYRAQDQRTGDEVALKLLSSGPALDPNAARRMAREFEALEDLDHPNVVRVFDTGVYRGYPYLAMELIDGLNLREYMATDTGDFVAPVRRQSRERKAERTFSVPSVPLEVFTPQRLSEEPASDMSLFTDSVDSNPEDVESGPEALRRLADAIDEPITDDGSEDTTVPWKKEASSPSGHAEPPAPNLMRLNRPQRVGKLKDAFLQLCEALAYVHSHGLVHRDLKPSNVMVDDERRVKLMDFGLAKFLAEEASVTASGRIVGTYRYMAPEQILGERVDGRADLYSLGVMFYEFMCGRPPYNAPTPLQLWQQMLDHEPTPLGTLNPDIDSNVARIAHRLMLKDPTDRFQTAEEVYDALLT